MRIDISSRKHPRFEELIEVARSKRNSKKGKLFSQVYWISTTGRHFCKMLRNSLDEILRVLRSSAFPGLFRMKKPPIIGY